MFGLSDLAKEIADAFGTEIITHSDISPHSISELGINYLGKPIIVTWYPGRVRRFRTLNVDGTEGVFPANKDSKHIFRAALRRADNLITEKMSELEDVRRAQT